MTQNLVQIESIHANYALAAPKGFQPRSGESALADNQAARPFRFVLDLPRGGTLYNLSLAG